MKATDKNKRIPTAPKSAWESGIINKEEGHSKKRNPNDITTDSQGNGYPIFRKNQDK